MNNAAMNIGQVIRALRIERGLTQEELALEAEVATSNVSRIENGLRQPTTGLLKRLAKALGINVSQLYALVEETTLPSLRCEFNATPHFDPSKEVWFDPTSFDVVQQLADDPLDNDIPLLLRYFRELNANNRELVMEQIKLLRKQQLRSDASETDKP